MGPQPDPSACSPQPSEDPASRLSCPPNHLLLRRAEKTPPHRGFKGSPVPEHSPLGTRPPSAGFTAPGKAVSRTDWAPAPPSTLRAGPGWPRGPPRFHPQAWGGITLGPSVGEQLRAGWEEGCDPCPFPWQLPGSQHVSQAPRSLGPGGPAWAGGDQMSPAWESLCVKSLRRTPRGALPGVGMNGLL